MMLCHQAPYFYRNLSGRNEINHVYDLNQNNGCPGEFLTRDIPNKSHELSLSRFVLILYRDSRFLMTQFLAKIKYYMR